MPMFCNVCIPYMSWKYTNSVNGYFISAILTF